MTRHEQHDDDTISPADMATGAWARTIDAIAPHDDQLGTVRYRVGWAVPYAVQQITGDGRIEIDATFATIPEALRAAADMIETYDVPIGYVFDITETDR